MIESLIIKYIIAKLIIIIEKEIIIELIIEKIMEKEIIIKVTKHNAHTDADGNGLALGDGSHEKGKKVLSMVILDVGHKPDGRHDNKIGESAVLGSKHIANANGDANSIVKPLVVEAV